MNYKMIRYIIGWVLIFEALFMGVPLVTAVIYSESAFGAFITAILICLLCGALMIIKKPSNTTLYSREGYIIVALSWIALSVFGAIPFYLSGATESWIDALFETVSGFTTTGASVIANVEALPRAILIWRSFSQWIGGMGVLVFIMAFVSLSGGQNMHIMKAESPGPSVSKLVPRVKNTASILYAIYITLTVIQLAVLLLAGMDVFDAINTAFATAGTGGFAVRNDGMSSYSPTIQIIITVFMLLFSLSFNSYYLILHKKIKEAFNTEVRFFLIAVTASIVIMAVNISGMFSTPGEAIRQSAFAAASVVSTTGFSAADFNVWPELSRTILVVLMFMGACAGSTGGGIKASRIIILLKYMKNRLHLLVHPKRVQKITLDSHLVEDDVVQNVLLFAVCYVALFAVSFIILSLENYGGITNATAVVTAISNVGPGLGRVGPTQNFGFLSTTSKLVLAFDMLAGRLELFPILLLFMPSTWKK